MLNPPDAPSLAEGLHERLLTSEVQRALDHLAVDGWSATTDSLSADQLPTVLASHLARVLGRALPKDPEKQVALTNALLVVMQQHAPSSTAKSLPAEHVHTPPRELSALVRKRPPLQPEPPLRPHTRLSESALLTNASGDEAIGPALIAELASADRVDLLCAFIRWHGLRLLLGPLQALTARGGTLRVLTSTYMGGTERAALDRLETLGAEIRVAYESKTTRLHAKAWLIHRESGYSTAYIGSSNLSRAAMLDGVEWNVRLAETASPHLLSKFRATFDSYWESHRFEPYTQADNAAQFDLAVRREQGASVAASLLSPFEIRPYPYQRAMLEQLAAERALHHRFANLVVAATGTGKTVLAAFDYLAIARQHAAPPRLLFVAHRKEILQQALATFRQIMRDGTFGELAVANHKPVRWQHVFASIQSLRAQTALPADHFDVVIIDEFHHAAAASYTRLLDHIEPQILLGLTATPERADGLDILRWFGGKPAVELRIWDALDQQLLCPFHYFGVNDETDLRGDDLWRNGRYDLAALEGVYTADHGRVALILRALRTQILDLGAMRAIGFCVTRKHATFMAEAFTRAGIPSLAVLGTTDHDSRDAALRKLRKGEVNVLFAVDIYNEGVDVPEVDTLLMLRPTHSATLFLQQLGRGLRLSDDKPCCTVLDFIGLQHRRFRFDLRYRALTGASRKGLEQGIAEGFARLPAGCHITFDRVARQRVLAHIRACLPTTQQQLVTELQRLGPKTSLAEFLEQTVLEPEDLYRSKRTFTALRRGAGFDSNSNDKDTALLARLQTLLHIDDLARVTAYVTLLQQPRPPQISALEPRELRLVTMLHFGLRGHAAAWRALQRSMDDLWSHDAVRLELSELLRLQGSRAMTVTHDLSLLRPVPLRVHARYTRDEIRAALGDLTAEQPWSHREGVMRSRDNALDVLFVTLNKDAKHFSPSTSYRDYPISDVLFHWESQSVTSVESATGQRYLNHKAEGSNVLLCVRETGKDSRGVAAPFTCLGLVDYVRHQGSRPIAITWRLRQPMPAVLFERGKAVAG